jgi:acyl-CoA synthetase (AMP-forming)/AMP-acid ligase II
VALVAELGVRGVETADGERIVADVRQAIAEAHGIQLSGVALVTPGSVPRTTSGKLQRFLCRDAWLRGRLDPLVLWQEPMVSAG